MMLAGLTAGGKVYPPYAPVVAPAVCHAGAVELVTTPNTEGPVLSTHAVGGTRMGDNPETNVVDKWCFSHEAPNLGILGGSVACTHGARNPTLTIQALCWRTAEHLVKNWKSIAG